MRKHYIEKLLEFEDVYLDYPFDDTNWAAVRHNCNKKTFAFVYNRNGKLCINFKNTPEWASFWRESFKSVSPAYHMNKEHWSTVVCGEDADEEQILQMVGDSYRLTLKKGKKNEFTVKKSD